MEPTPTLKAEFCSLPDAWRTNARRHPDKPAIIFGERRLSWSDLARGVKQVVSCLRSDGVAKGDKVALLAATSIETVVVMLGVLHSGACLVPLSTMLAPEQVHTLLDDCRPRKVFASRAFQGVMDDVRSRTTFLRQGDWYGVDFEGDGWRGIRPFRQEAEAALEVREQFQPADDCLLIYSSGTTGLPKGLLHSHYSRYQFAQLLGHETRMDSRSIALVSTGLYSSGTQMMVLPVLLLGGTLVLLDQFTPEAFMASVQRERVTHTFVVPSQLQAILQSPALPSADLSSLQCVLSAGAPLRVDLKQAILSRVTPNLFELYGMSEGLATMLRPEDMEQKIATCGSAISGNEFFAVNGDGQIVAPGEVGEIVGSGSLMMTGYYGRDTETRAATWVHPSGRAFLRTGDIGRVDEQGFLTIIDRKKDMIISGGLNVYPVDIEGELAKHESVAEAAVIGIPDDKWGERAVGIVIPRAGSSIEASDLLAWANARLAVHQRMVSIIVRNDPFPRNGLGKVLKRTLRQELAQQAANA